MSYPTRATVDFDFVVAGYLAIVAVVLPIAALRSRRVPATFDRRSAPRWPSRPQRPSRSGRSRRTSTLTRAILVQLALFALTMIVARSHGIPIWQNNGFDPRDLIVGASALGALGAAGYLSWRFRSPDERRRHWIRHVLPSTRWQWALWIAVSALAALSEETTFRGMLVMLFGALTASTLVAILLSALVFALVHYQQDLRTALMVFAAALVMQAVVFATGALFVAIGVHAAYDALLAVGSRE